MILFYLNNLFYLSYPGHVTLRAGINFQLVTLHSTNYQHNFTHFWTTQYLRMISTGRIDTTWIDLKLNSWICIKEFIIYETRQQTILNIAYQDRWVKILCTHSTSKGTEEKYQRSKEVTVNLCPSGVTTTLGFGDRFSSSPDTIFDLHVLLSERLAPRDSCWLITPNEDVISRWRRKTETLHVRTWPLGSSNPPPPPPPGRHTCACLGR